ncbi:Sec-independent protein translocase protein TatB [Methylobacterium sp. J-077]|uniref:Sec-independent protein translocase protein TatB n=1 Tax=Methylobacterium sp. J-077 TaxID=2836656 RepID=UPI001FBA5E37|nr:Sec-independent protein translocase protein TatB [Methylobacterium sp. J-077]MCJ2122013.1 Sec-independent protein translocase protein TatB [Methylobacterium sp. J-077]
MLDMSWGEVMLIGGVALIVIGPKDLPKALRTVGQITTKLRRMAGEFQMQFNEAIREAELDEVRKEVDGIRNTVRAASSGFNPVQTIRDELKGAVEGRVAARQGSETLGPEKPAPDVRSLADATAQLKAEQEATASAGAEPELAAAEPAAHSQPVQHAASEETPLPIPGSVDDPYGPPPEPEPTHDAPMDPKNGTAVR